MPEVEPDPFPPTDDQPVYRHNCSLCIFLGGADFGGYHDLYFCRQGHLFPTVIARASSDAHDYISGMALAAYEPLLREAFERAKQRELIAHDAVPPEDESIG